MFKEIDEVLLAPVVEALRPLAEVTVESQVIILYFSFFSHEFLFLDFLFFFLYYYYFVKYM